MEYGTCSCLTKVLPLSLLPCPSSPALRYTPALSLNLAPALSSPLSDWPVCPETLHSGAMLLSCEHSLVPRAQPSSPALLRTSAMQPIFAHLVHLYLVPCRTVCSTTCMFCPTPAAPSTSPTTSPTTQPCAGTLQVTRPYHIRVLVPCYKESLDILRRTIMAAYDATMPDGCSRTIYLCDDGKDPKKRKWVDSLGPEVVYVSGRKRAAGGLRGLQLTVKVKDGNIYCS